MSFVTELLKSKDVMCGCERVTEHFERQEARFYYAIPEKVSQTAACPLW